MEAVIEEQRHPLEWGQFQVAQNRTQPGLLIVDESLNVVFFREDPHERRTSCRVEAATHSLPAALRGRLSELGIKSSSALPRVWAIPDASLIVRTIVLDALGGATPLTALLVERYTKRNYVGAIAARYCLTPRETDVLKMLLRGGKNEEIAAELNVAVSTVIFHVKSLFDKTGARNRTELVARLAD
ncbi:MAG: helix-turn-helix transcriptional regulator [Candidatus Eremiobacteraeota bacterium]|nr:helix-turn-helix transcriptional regulator [Candidatus Eremiobacteraeota bacterium]